VWVIFLMSPIPVGITIWFGWGLFVFYIGAFTHTKFADGKTSNHGFMDGEDMGPGPATTMSMYNDIGDRFGGAYED